MTWILHHHLDLLAFGVIVAAGVLLVFATLRKSRRLVRWCTCAGLLVGGILSIAVALVSGEEERSRLVIVVSGLAPNYALELHQHGHERINPGTSSHDPTYRELIRAQADWLRVNPAISDIYTIGRDSNGVVRILVDSETDYDRNGIIEGDRESRTPVGEPYDADEMMLRVLDEGVPQFQSNPYTDRWGTWVSAYHPLKDATGRTYALVGVDFPADKWVQAILKARLFVLLIGLVVMAILAVTVVMTARLRAEVRRSVALQAELTLASRHAGMAEVATGVLHNVGNVLNSVNTSATVIREKVEGSRLVGLTKAAAMIRSQPDAPAFIANDPKGRMLPDYIARIADVISHEHDAIRDELGHLARGIDHIKHIVAAQQSFAKLGTQPHASVSAVELAEEAIRINAIAFSRHGVELLRDFQADPVVKTDRHKVMQILVNLLSNAKQAVSDPSVTDRRITVSITQPEPNACEISVTDTGVGIAPENFAKLFQHGFTTKQDGHGFGLHTAAIDARVLGGALTAFSDGIGRGARFTLRLTSREEACAAS
jgi:signal transduction histidine kinase